MNKWIFTDIRVKIIYYTNTSLETLFTNGKCIKLYLKIISVKISKSVKIGWIFDHKTIDHWPIMHIQLLNMIITHQSKMFGAHWSSGSAFDCWSRGPWFVFYTWISKGTINESLRGSNRPMCELAPWEGCVCAI